VISAGIIYKQITLLPRWAASINGKISCGDKNIDSSEYCHQLGLGVSAAKHRFALGLVYFYLG